MLDIFRPPVFDDDEATERARNLFVVAWVTLALDMFFMSAIALAQPALISRTAASVATVLPLCAIVLLMNRSGRTVAASALLVAGLVLHVTMMALAAGGIRSPGVTMFCVFALMAGMLLGMRSGIITAASCALIGLGLVAAEMGGVLPEQTAFYGPITYWLLNSLYMGLVVLLLEMATSKIRRALKRRDSELAERKTVERQRDLALDAGAVGLWDGDLRSDHFVGDRRSLAIFGFPWSSEGTVAIEEWKATVHPDDLSGVAAATRELGEGKEHVRVECRVIRPSDGTLRHIEATAAPIRDASGHIERHAGTVVDITGRKTLDAERNDLVVALRERMKELRCLYRVLELTTDETRSAEAICSDIAAVLPASMLHAKHAVARIVVRSGESRSPDWEPPDMRLESPIIVDGETVGFVEVGYLGGGDGETTDQRAFLAEEESLIDGIALHVARMLAARQTAENLRHTERIAAVGQLTGGIAHDFNNLLHVILGNSELLTQGLAGDAKLGALAEITVAAAQRAAELTSRLLAFSRRQALSPSLTDPAELLEDLGGLLERTLGAGITLETEFGETVPAVLVDAPQLENAIVNLCINSRDAMPEGGRLKIALSSTYLSSQDMPPGQQADPGEYVLIAVSDFGHGMPPEVLARAFEPFFTTKAIGQGSGLGLSMVFGFVRQSRGCIRIDSEVGKGTTIGLYFPAAQEEFAAGQPMLARA